MEVRNSCGAQDVIGHQYIGVHGGGMPRRGLLRARQVEARVVFIQEDRLTIMSTLDDMLRNAREGVVG
jgi:hypothetical protein